MNLKGVKVCFPEDHPCLEGHFPGNPIIPGVLILEEVVQAIKDQMSLIEIRSIASLKFISTLKPGVELSITFTWVSKENIGFTCSHSGGVIVKGQIGISCKEHE